MPLPAAGDCKYATIVPMLMIRTIFVVYWLLLSFLLLTPDPLALLGFPMPPGPPGGRGIHFALFTLFGFLVHAARWPLRPRPLVGWLVAYAACAEAMQAFVPTRVVDIIDLVENMLGLLAGWAVWRLVRS